jgi:outer membrane protein assembly factor BamB
LKLAGFLALATTVSGALAFAEPALYGIGPDGPFPLSLYSVSAESGAITLLGPITGALFTNAFAFAPDGTLFASAHGSFEQEFDPKTGAVIRETPLTGVTYYVDSTAYAFSPGGTLFAIYGNELLYSINTANSTGVLVGSVGSISGTASLAISNNGTLFLSDETNLYIVDSNTAALSLVAPSVLLQISARADRQILCR